MKVLFFTSSHTRSEYKEGKLLLVYHPMDESCRSTALEYQPFLKENDRTFVHLDLKEMFNCWSRLSLPVRYSQWIIKFKERYLII